MERQNQKIKIYPVLKGKTLRDRRYKDKSASGCLKRVQAKTATSCGSACMTHIVWASDKLKAKLGVALLCHTEDCLKTSGGWHWS